MNGSGKTTLINKLCKRMDKHLHMNNKSFFDILYIWPNINILMIRTIILFAHQVGIEELMLRNIETLSSGQKKNCYLSW